MGDPVDMFVGDPWVEWQGERSIADALGHRKGPGLEGEALAEIGEKVDGPIVDHRWNPALLESGDDSVTLSAHDPDWEEMVSVLDTGECLGPRQAGDFREQALVTPGHILPLPPRRVEAVDLRQE